MIHYENMTKDRIISLLKDTLEYAEEKDKEIERLNGALQTHEILLKSNTLEIERLNNIIKTKDEGIKAFTEDLCEESAKIEKAIEYIEKHTENIDRGQYYEDYVETYPVLQILKGSESNGS